MTDETGPETPRPALPSDEEMAAAREAKARRIAEAYAPLRRDVLALVWPQLWEFFISGCTAKGDGDRYLGFFIALSDFERWISTGALPTRPGPAGGADTGGAE